MPWSIGDYYSTAAYSACFKCETETPVLIGYSGYIITGFNGDEGLFDFCVFIAVAFGLLYFYYTYTR